MKTVFTLTIDTELEVESFWWRFVMTRYVESILTKEAVDFKRRNKKANIDFSVDVDCIEGGTPCRTDGHPI